MTSLIETKDLRDHYATKLITSEIPISDRFTLVRYKNNLDHKLIEELKVDFIGLEHHESRVMANPAVSSAVTAYGRIHMMQFKTGEMADHIYYTDTDSIFTDVKLPDHMVGKGLGLMKDELDGGVITKAVFLGIKRYCIPSGTARKRFY